MKKRFNIMNHQENANQNHSKRLPQPCEHGYYQKDYINK